MGDIEVKKKKLKIKKPIVIALVVAIVAGIIVGGVFVYNRLTPSKERMSGYEYFHVSENADSVLVILDDEAFSDAGYLIDSRVYLPWEFVANNINVRFYYDTETNMIMSADYQHLYYFKENEKGYTDQNGKVYDTEYPIYRKCNDTVCIAWDFVAERTNCIYNFSEQPNRIVVSTHFYERNMLNANEQVDIRYRAGIKSKIVETVPKETELMFLETEGDWTKVKTDSGISGYVKTSKLSGVYQKITENVFVEKYETGNSNEKINLAWFQLSSINDNTKIDAYLEDTYGINVISPTWYAINNAQGDVNCYASKEFVENLHDKGIKVWPLINDFDKTIDFNSMYKSRTARYNLINRLIEDAIEYDYDGLNIDFEYVTKDNAIDFLQFIRELGIACRSNNITLSMDNYKPVSFRRYYRLSEQAVFMNYIMIMGYDEHWNGSEAGSVSSLPFYKECIDQTLALVPKEQIVMALPFYTRIWTINENGTVGKAVGIQNSIDTANKNNADIVWDDSVGQYTCEYDTPEGKNKIWIEEERSIEEKMKLIKNSDVAGVAEWKLGLERSSVWDVINKYL